MIIRVLIHWISNLRPYLNIMPLSTMQNGKTRTSVVFKQEVLTTERGKVLRPCIGDQGRQDFPPVLQVTMTTQLCPATVYHG